MFNMFNRKSTSSKIEKWLQKNNYSFTVLPEVGIMVNTPYTGIYPGKEQFNALSEIRSYIKKHYPDFSVEQRGNYTGVFIDFRIDEVMINKLLNVSL